jgi:hypothetical protein
MLPAPTTPPMCAWYSLDIYLIVYIKYFYVSKLGNTTNYEWSRIKKTREFVRKITQNYSIKFNLNINWGIVEKIKTYISKFPFYHNKSSYNMKVIFNLIDKSCMCVCVCV